MIISRSEIILSESQKKLVRSGWGESVADDVTVEKMLYDSIGREVEGYIAYPKQIKDKLPLIIWNRGGNLREGRIDEFLARGMFGEIASWGYVVLASQYRKDEEFGGRDVEDVLNLIPLSESLSFCNTDLIGMEGWSRGGMMAYKSLCHTERVKCAVVIAGVANLLRRSASLKKLERIYGHVLEEDSEAKMKHRSAVHFAEAISPDTAILLIHGTSDHTVSHLDSVEMYDILRELGRRVELRLVESGDHYLKKFRKEVSAMRKEWFDIYLRNELN